MTTPTHPDPVPATLSAPVLRTTMLDAKAAAPAAALVPPALHRALRGKPKS
jgi:hypothetical protein